MGGPVERVLTIASGGHDLHAVLHQPVGPPGRALVFCHPFAEEKKCAHRAMVDAARACAAAGWAVLRFDLRGCGDSPGSFEAFDLEDWREDVAAVVAQAGEASGAEAVGLLGLRLGATLAAQVAEEHAELACLVLWEPIVDGARYIAENLRRSMIRAVVTRHEGGERAEGAPVATPAPGEGTVDFDGYQVSAALRAQIAAVDLLARPRAYAGPTLIVNLTARDAVAAPLRKLADAYPSGSAIVVRQEPIWQRIGIIDATPAIGATVEWLTQLR
ncbi:MAG: alpha/beta fold hydrolase [Armatimonadota bacterium]